MKHEAIYKLYSNAVTIEETEDGTLTVFDASGNQITIDDSAVSTKATELEAAETTAATNKANAKTSGLAKLKADTWSPLTDDEADALFGD